MQTSGSASASSFRKNCRVSLGGVCVDIATCTARWAPSQASSPATQEDATLYKRPSEVGVKPKGLFSHNENWETDVPLT